MLQWRVLSGLHFLKTASEKMVCPLISQKVCPSKNPVTLPQYELQVTVLHSDTHTRLSSGEQIWIDRSQGEQTEGRKQQT